MKSPKGKSGWSDVAWIADLAEPYLRGYRAECEDSAALQGYWFDAPSDRVRKAASKGRKKNIPGHCGFFAGYLLQGKKFSYLNAETPECLVFVTLGEPESKFHQRLVVPPESLLRKTQTYIGWLTHRPPRFAFFEDQFISLVRHRTMQDWPSEKYLHFSRNFFIETLAWLVRSGLVRKLLEVCKTN